LPAVEYETSRLNLVYSLNVHVTKYYVLITVSFVQNSEGDGEFVRGM